MLILSTSLTVISGCSSIKELEIFTKEVKRIPLNLDEPNPLKLGKVDWVVINNNNEITSFWDWEEPEVNGDE